MAYVDGYRLKMSDGTTANVIPHGPEAELIVGPLLITVTTENSKTHVSVSFEVDEKSVDIPVVRFGKVRLQKPSKTVESQLEHTAGGVARRCAVCKGRRYCVTNGCINTGCGWLCSEP